MRDYYEMGYGWSATKQYPYRTAMVRNIFLEIPRGRFNEPLNLMESEWNAQAGSRPDNHVVFKLENREESRVLYALCSDSHISFGFDIEEKRW